MTIYLQKMIKREDAKANPSALFIFGDNFERRGYGGQARELRDEPNALGIPTKVNPVTYLSNDHFEKWLDIAFLRFATIKQWSVNKLVVYPSDGVGTGLAKLEEKAPKIWLRLKQFEESVGIKL